MTSLTQITVPFHEAELYLIEQNGQPYTPMKPIVEGMGLAWQAQLAKFNSNVQRWGITKIVIPTLGDLQEMVCLPLRKLFAWLMTISPNKVKPELRETVIMYQNECDDVLWDYWTKGQAINQRKAISPEQQALLHEIVARRSNGERKIYAEMWARHNRHFKIAKYSQLLAVHFPEAVHYLETMDVKAKPEAKNEYVQLPIKPQVLTIASSISNSWVKTQHQNWFVQADNHGNISIMSLPFGYYPFNIAEFTKHFDEVLNTLYGADILSVGRYFLKEMK
ncbi:phage antirepressor N-terminal domain-containing protein [Acinetobacter sp. ME22]|uniref:phage antirepressor N-terminal domain-containing protein n=1 Tax=Acinetobacter sp. ME22 TaxID=2904802 RepID=UPI001ED9FC00|nr:phage antirepressor N-terminal domain-containing protein [Acinetobacter sp. ME22]MCG2575203.1 phage antirepressor N-terminal domain-containing protein [Acinetobacter sp. ME22]